MKELLETAYTHDAGCDYFTLSACESWSIAMAKRLHREHPDKVKIVVTNPDGTIMAHIPFEWMRIIPKRKTENMKGNPESLRRARNTRKTVATSEK